MPKKRRCRCGRKIEEYEDECIKCMKLVCPCGRKFDYPSRRGGRPPSRCPQCEDLRGDLRTCPCGALLRSSQRVYCTATCRREARRVRRGAIPRDGWRDRVISAFQDDQRHEKVAKLVAAWLRYYAAKNVWAKDMAVVFIDARVRYECRHTEIPFKCADDLPRWVYVDYRTMLTSLQTLRPPATHRLAGYILGSQGFETVAFIPARESDIQIWKRRRAWIPRLADFDDELYCQRERCEIHSLLKKPTFI